MTEATSTEPATPAPTSSTPRLTIDPPCDLATGRFCGVMASQVHDDRWSGIPARKGLVAIYVIPEWQRASEWTPRLAGVAYKSSSTAKGIMLRMCPWCGAPLERDVRTGSEVA
ncbi:MAG: hypothetical protein R3B99_35915 [Polyangiales bacterium]|nr:hypothetical protein [Myxococcales bacterium]MCB9601275.1 hypothetical protein [Sandaracinus sp.]